MRLSNGRRPRTSWAQYNQEVEAENERQKEAIRQFRMRQAQPRPMTHGQRVVIDFAWFVVKVLIGSAAAGAFVWGAFHFHG